MFEKISHLHLFVFLSLIAGFNVHASEKRAFSDSLKSALNRPHDKIITNYLAVHQKYFSQLCTPGTEERFNQLHKNFRGFGFYIPTRLDDQLDLERVIQFLPDIKEKKTWILGLIEYVNQLESKSFTQLRSDIKTLQDLFEQLMQDKKKYYFETSKRDEFEKKSNQRLSTFSNKWQKFLGKIPFLLSFRHPLDHFDLRKRNDYFRSKEGEQARLKANEVYFYRQIVQDGAQNPDRSRSDAFLRSVIDSVTLSIYQETPPISESFRYDFDFVLRNLDRQISSGKDTLLLRLKEWRDRTQSAIDFYNELIAQNRDTDEVETSPDMTTLLISARDALESYSMEKMAEAYHFWADQSELMRALFVLQTILYNEAGDLDGRDALERRDIAQVVINRVFTPKYSMFLDDDPFLSHLELSKEKRSQLPWLNALFKRGEFSFTYYFIPSNVRIYCPESTRRGRFLLRENLSVALDRLKDPNFDFNALRYFSRHSMQGRIDMSEIWSDYTSINERQGLVISQDRRLRKAYDNGDYQFLYRFINPEQQIFDVVSISGSTYSFGQASRKFYTYRNPHFFRYFRPLLNSIE